MTETADFTAQEHEFQRRWHQAHIDRFDAVKGSAVSWRNQRLSPHAEEASSFLDALTRTRDLSGFQAGTHRWSRSFESGYSGTAGQMIINQINKMSPDPDTAVTVLVDALTTPTDLDDAVGKIRRLADHLQEIRVGAHPSPKRAPFVASYFWGLAEPQTWAVAWPKSVEYVGHLTGVSDFDDQGDRYAELYRCATEIDGSPERFEQVAAWWADEQPAFVDEVLCDRVEFHDGAKERDDDPELYRDNAGVLVAVAKHLAESLESPVSGAAGRTLKAHKPPVMWTAKWPRGDLWSEWRIPDTYGLSVRIWLNAAGLAIGLRPYPDAETGATERSVAIIDSHPIPGYEILAGGRSRLGRNVGFAGGGTGEVIYARWFDRSEFASLDLTAQVCQAARDVAPLMAELNKLREDDDKPITDEPIEDSDPGLSPDALDDLAEELLVDRVFLADVVALLEDKKQVVFYGPPGTGKTFFARKLAEKLAPDAARRPIVQFHPSTSYEDFFEGYRPETDTNGVLSYRLRKGPLAELAASANGSPGQRYLMIIDEINRANLPKVLGELLFLFEYRDTPIRTLYRPDDPFELSKDVWFIGTMNTADRSIALVDAALRRRFHFIPFFPNHGPMAGLLGRWLEREGEPAWVGELVEQVNDELTRELGGPHLQLGPSHFMKHDLDEDSLRRIWAYDIEPLIEDQFFGDTARTDAFRFTQVWKRFNNVAPESVVEGDTQIH